MVARGHDGLALPATRPPRPSEKADQNLGRFLTGDDRFKAEAGIRYLSKVFELPGKSHNEADMKRMCLPIKASASSILMMNR